MATDLLYDESPTVQHFDPEGVIPTAATCTLYKPDGSDSGLTGSVSLPTASTTIASASTTEALELTSASGFAVGDRIVVTSDGVAMVGEIVRLDGTTCHLLAAIGFAPDTSSTVAKLDMSCTITGLAVGDIGPNWRIQWEITSPSNKRASDVAHVVRWMWDQPIRAHDIEQHVAFEFPSVVRSPGYYARVASIANERVRRVIQGTGKRPNLYGDASLFDDAAMVWARFQLAREGLVPRGSNPGLFQEQLKAEFNTEMNTAINSLAFYDADEDGSIDSTEAKGQWPVITLSR